MQNLKKLYQYNKNMDNLIPFSIITLTEKYLLSFGKIKQFLEDIRTWHLIENLTHLAEHIV